MSTSDWVQVALIIIVGILLAVFIKAVLALKEAFGNSFLGKL